MRLAALGPTGRPRATTGACETRAVISPRQVPTWLPHGPCEIVGRPPSAAGRLGQRPCRQALVRRKHESMASTAAALRMACGFLEARRPSFASVGEGHWARPSQGLLALSLLALRHARQGGGRASPPHAHPAPRATQWLSPPSPTPGPLPQTHARALLGHGTVAMADLAIPARHVSWRFANAYGAMVALNVANPGCETNTVWGGRDSVRLYITSISSPAALACKRRRPSCSTTLHAQ